MKHSLTLAALAAALSLSACNQSDEPEVAAAANGSAANQQTANVALPALPVITATHRYRCSGSNEVVQIDWLELDGQPAQTNLRRGEAVVPTVLAAPAEGTGPYSAPDGSTLEGTKDATSITFTPAGGDALTCRR